MGFLMGLGCGGDSWVVLSWWLENCLLLLCWVAVIVGKERELEWGEESDQREREREVEREKKIKYTSYSNRAYMHDYCSKVYKYTILYPLMWVFFLPKSVKWKDFCILEDYALNDMDALNMIYKWVFFLAKKCKMKRFLYFRRLCTQWCGCSKYDCINNNNNKIITNNPSKISKTYHNF